MKSEAKKLFNHFNITHFSKYLKSDIIEQYYYEYLNEQNKRTRSDCKILCHNMILFILLWVLNPGNGYLSILNKAKCFLIKVNNNISEIMLSITEAGLCKARRRFSSEILKKLWQIDIIGAFVKETQINLWKGFQVCGFDGTTFTLNKSENILKSFPLINKARWPKMIVGLLYDVYSKIPLDIECGNYKCSERYLLSKVIERIKTKILMLLDRGYHSFWTIQKLTIYNIDFVMRIPKCVTYKIVRKIGRNDLIVIITNSKHGKQICKKRLTIDEYNCLPKTFTVRLIKTQIKGFRVRFIITSLIDKDKYSYNEISKLYCDRWIIENYYRDLKHIFKIEKFHACYVDGIYQEIYASMILTILLQRYINNAADKFNVPFEEISFKKTFQILADFIYLLELLPQMNKVLIDLMLNLIANSKQKKRPGRHYKRVFYRKTICLEYKSR